MHDGPTDHPKSSQASIAHDTVISLLHREAYEMFAENGSGVGCIAACALSAYAMDLGRPLHSRAKSWVTPSFDLAGLDELLRLAKCEVTDVGWAIDATDKVDRPCHWILKWQDAVASLLIKGRSHRTETVISLRFRSTDPQHDGYRILCEAFNSLPKLPTREKIRQRVHALTQTNQGLTLSPLGSFTKQLVRRNYEPRVLEAFDHAACCLQLKSPCGRLIVLSGAPGTGKTYLVRGLIETVKGMQFVVIPSVTLPALTQPALLRLLMLQSTPTCLILEDADMLLVDRRSDNMSALDTMLNFSDGMLGSLLDIRLICTTNASPSGFVFDKAMLRPERLCTHMTTGALPAGMANEIYSAELASPGPGPFEDQKTLAEIYSRLRKDGWSPSDPGMVSFRRDDDDDDDDCDGELFRGLEALRAKAHAKQWAIPATTRRLVDPT